MLSIVVIFNMLSILGVYYYHLPPPVIVKQQIKYLSYVPPLEFFSLRQPLYDISLQKINLLADDSMAKLEKFYPLIDKVIYIPDGYHEYALKG